MKICVFIILIEVLIFGGSPAHAETSVELALDEGRSSIGLNYGVGKVSDDTEEDRTAIWGLKSFSSHLAAGFKYESERRFGSQNTNFEVIGRAKIFSTSFAQLGYSFAIDRDEIHFLPNEKVELDIDVPWERIGSWNAHFDYKWYDSSSASYLFLSPSIESIRYFIVQPRLSYSQTRFYDGKSSFHDTSLGLKIINTWKSLWPFVFYYQGREPFVNRQEVLETIVISNGIGVELRYWEGWHSWLSLSQEMRSSPSRTINEFAFGVEVHSW